jgi:acetylornithine/N-succinyldiaminopimelate aminotransferase
MKTAKAMSTQPTDSPLFPTYARVDLEFERGEGAWLIAKDGKRYLDFMGGIAVNVLGHAHPHVVAALKAQAEKLWHVSNIFEIPGQRAPGERLAAATFADRCFFGNSGAEAMECAIKTARRYHFVNGRPEKYRIITFEGAFHGRTLATLAAGGQAKYLEGFGPKVDGFDQVPFCDLKAAEAAITPETAAILIEPIQGEGGIRPVPPEKLRQLRRLCDERGLLLIFDEIQSGMGRSGRFLAHEWAGIAPDIAALAKGLGAGFPVGVCLATREASAGMTTGTHGTTFGGNPLAMAVGAAVLDIILDEAFLERVRRTGLLLKQKLAAIADTHASIVEEIRGEGLILGIKCRIPNSDVATAARAAGLLLVPAGDNVVRLLPPLTIGEAEVEEAVHRLDTALSELTRRDAAE